MQLLLGELFLKLLPQSLRSLLHVKQIYIMNLRVIFSIAILTLATCGTSQLVAQTYTLGFDQANYTVGIGGTVDAQLILTEDISGGGIARLNPDNAVDDLFAFNLGVDFSSVTGAANGSTFESLVFAPGFAPVTDTTFTTVNDTGTVVSFETSTGVSPGVPGTAISASMYEVALATLTFNAGDASSVTTLQTVLSEITDSGTPSILFGTGDFPPIGTFNSSQITVAAVPEPGSAAVLALFGCAGFMTRRRK